MAMQTIFIVDDDSDIRELIAQTLGDEGYNVLALGDGEQAICEARTAPPALMLLDLMMPKMSGWEVTRQLRADPATAAIPVVLVSASREIEGAREQLGASGALAKPFDLDHLIAIVRSYVGEPATQAS